MGWRNFYLLWIDFTKFWSCSKFQKLPVHLLGITVESPDNKNFEILDFFYSKYICSSSLHSRDPKNPPYNLLKPKLKATELHIVEQFLILGKIANFHLVQGFTFLHLTPKSAHFRGWEQFHMKIYNILVNFHFVHHCRNL